MHNYHYLINVLHESVRACEHCSASILQEGKEIYLLVNCIKLNRDCADICILTSRLLERDSQLTNEILDACVKILQLCAEECEKFPQFMYCRQCEEVCRKAIKECGAQV